MSILDWFKEKEIHISFGENGSVPLKQNEIDALGNYEVMKTTAFELARWKMQLDDLVDIQNGKLKYFHNRQTAELYVELRESERRGDLFGRGLDLIARLKKVQELLAKRLTKDAIGLHIISKYEGEIHTMLKEIDNRDEIFKNLVKK